MYTAWKNMYGTNVVAEDNQSQNSKKKFAVCWLVVHNNNIGFVHIFPGRVYVALPPLPLIQSLSVRRDLWEWVTVKPRIFLLDHGSPIVHVSVSDGRWKLEYFSDTFLMYFRFWFHFQGAGRWVRDRPSRCQRSGPTPGSTRVSPATLFQVCGSEISDNVNVYKK